MNPPAALHSAMSRERKPFTYTPGGLDLSEIKSSRMAARLMRNAMNEGVPEVPKQSIPSSPQANPVAVPNYNCLPVQVFPTFNLPANPKSLLRTRSIPNQPRDFPVQKPPPQQTPFVNSSMTSGPAQYDTFNKNITAYSQVNNNRPVSMFEYGSPAHPYIPPSFGNDGYSSNLPEISYEAEYFRAPPRQYTDNGTLSNEITKNDNISDKTTISNVTSPFSEAYKYPELTVDSFKPQTEEKQSELPTIGSIQLDRYSEKIHEPEINNEKISVPNIENEKSTFEDKFKLNVENKETSVTVKENIVPEKENPAPKTEKLEMLNDTFENISDPEIIYDNYSVDIDPKTITDYATFVPETKLSKPIEDYMGADDQKVQLKSLYTYYIYVYLSVFLISYIYLLYNVKEL